MRQRWKQGSHIGNYCNNRDEMIMAWTRRVSGKGEKRSDFEYVSKPLRAGIAEA